MTYFEINREQQQSEWQYVERSLTLAIRFNESKIVGNIDGQEVINLRLTTEMPFRFALFLLGSGGANEPGKAEPIRPADDHAASRKLTTSETPSTRVDSPMTPQFSELVHPVISYALDLKDRLDNGEEPDLEAEQRQLIDRLRSDGEVRRLSDYTGDGHDLPRCPLRPDLLDRRAVHRLLVLVGALEGEDPRGRPLRDPGSGLEILGPGRDRPAQAQHAQALHPAGPRRPGDVLPLHRAGLPG